MIEELRQYPTHIDIPVAWGDMDAFGHVNNTRHFRWFESARIAYFRQAGVVTGSAPAGRGPILAATECQYKAPIVFPDTVTSCARVEALGRDRLRMAYMLVSQCLGRVAARGSGTIVWYDYEAGQKASIPEQLRKTILELEASIGQAPSELSA